MFKSFLTVLCAGAIFFAPSLASAAVEIWNLFYADDYEESISAESMLNLSVESFNGPWGDVLKMSMDIKDNQVYGWKYIAGDTAGKEAYSWVLWQNAYKDTTYALSCAGTDSPFDIATFLPMMVDEDYSEQMNAAIESVKNIKNIIPTNKIEKLYITGHSLGGYLAMFLGTELVEASVNPALSDLPFSTTFGEKGIGLTMDDISIVTFGAPGFYKTTIKFADKVVKFLEEEGITVYEGGVASPSWAQQKFANDAKDMYDKYITNYKNSYDPVANLMVAPSAFVHVGTTHNIDVKKPNMLEANIRWLLNKIPVVNYGYRITNVEQHAPWVYKDMLNSI